MRPRGFIAANIAQKNYINNFKKKIVFFFHKLCKKSYLVVKLFLNNEFFELIPNFIFLNVKEKRHAIITPFHITNRLRLDLTYSPVIMLTPHNFRNFFIFSSSSFNVEQETNEFDLWSSSLKKPHHSTYKSGLLSFFFYWNNWQTLHFIFNFYKKIAQTGKHFPNRQTLPKPGVVNIEFFDYWINQIQSNAIEWLKFN